MSHFKIIIDIDYFHFIKYALYMFNFLDHLYLGIFSLVVSGYFLGTFLVILCLPRIEAITQLKKIYFLSVLAIVLFYIVYGFFFTDNVCSNYMKLKPNNCGGGSLIIIDDSPSFSIEIRRDLPSEDNGMVLGKKGPAFITKQEKFYVSIPLRIQFKDNESLFFLESNKKEILEKVNDFMSFKDVKL
jgi:hypothetical protein